MDTALRPREIQYRIRSGETPESVASAAGMTLEKIMPFAGPVMAERAHVADRAQRSSLRRLSVEVAARTLGDAVASRLRAVNVAPDTVEWDSWRREDGRWTLTGDFAAGGQAGTARFSYDAPGNFVICDNDEARWLVGDTEDDAPRGVAPVGRRLTAVPVDDPPSGGELGDDVLELLGDQPLPGADADSTVDLTETVDSLRESPRPDSSLPDPSLGGSSLGVETPVEAFLDEPLPVEAAEFEDSRTDQEPGTGPVRRPVRKTRGRASVPSWDEIMFGGSHD